MINVHLRRELVRLDIPVSLLQYLAEPGVPASPRSCRGTELFVQIRQPFRQLGQRRRVDDVQIDGFTFRSAVIRASVAF